MTQEEVFNMPEKEYLSFKRNLKRSREMNDQNVLDLEIRARHSKAIYEDVHYELLRMQDLLQMDDLKSKYDELMNRLRQEVKEGVE